MIDNVKSFLQDEEGQSMVEYGVTLGAIAAVSYIAVVQLGDKTADLYAWMANHLPGGEDDEAGTDQLVRLVGEGLVALTGDGATGAEFDANAHVNSGTLDNNLGGPSTLIEED
jgi:Flp pilus assembly pilin Flp